MNEFEKTNKQHVLKGNNRRSFLKKSATGAVVFSLPAKSVWGACSVSGSMSGNLSTNTDRHDCPLPPFMSGPEGAGPSIWSDLDINVISLFSELGINPSKKQLYIDHVNMTKGLSLNLPIEIVDPSPTVGDALMNGTTEIKNLAAVYLNSFYELYSDYSGFGMTEQLVTDFFLYIYTNQVQNNNITLSDSDYGFTSAYSQSPLMLP